jgi:hypothetical protein
VDLGREQNFAGLIQAQQLLALPGGHAQPIARCDLPAGCLGQTRGQRALEIGELDPARHLMIL